MEPAPPRQPQGPSFRDYSGFPKTSPLQQTGFAIITGLPLLASCFVGGRLYARKKLRLPWDWDDYVISIAAVLSIALIYPSYRVVQMWHFGIHIWLVDPRELEPNYDEYHRVLLVFNILNTPILPLVKASILLLLLKVGKLVPTIRRLLHLLLFFIFGACVGPWVAMIFMCAPRSNHTTSSTIFGGQKCLNRREGAIVYLFLLSVNIFTDLLILPIPNILLWRVKNISFRARMTVFVVSLLMLGATGIAAARFGEELQHQLNSVDVKDWTYTIRFTLHHAENNVAIMLACMPMLRTLILQWHRTNRKPTGNSTDVVHNRRLQRIRNSIRLRSYDEEDGMIDGVIDPAPLEKREAMFEEAMVELERELKEAEAGGEMIFEQDERTGRIMMVRIDEGAAVTVPKKVARYSWGRSAPDKQSVDRIEAF